MALEGNMLTKSSQRKTNITHYMRNLKNKTINEYNKTNSQIQGTSWCLPVGRNRKGQDGVIKKYKFPIMK